MSSRGVLVGKEVGRGVCVVLLLLWEVVDVRDRVTGRRSVVFAAGFVVSSLNRVFLVERNVETESSSKGPVGGGVEALTKSTFSRSTIT